MIIEKNNLNTIIYSFISEGLYMQLSYLESIPNEWQRVLVIGRTAEHNGKKYHIVGMTSGDKLKILILEPFDEPELPARRGKDSGNQRKRLKEHRENGLSYLHCREISIGDRRLKIQGGSGSPLKYSEQDYRTITLFLDMMRAGWTVPDWLREKEWDELQLVTLEIAGLKRLPKYSPQMPILIKHRPDPICHIIEKTITLTVGKKRSFSFIDHNREQVWCHINDITLIDVWEDTEKQFHDPKFIKKVPPERMAEIKENCHKALEQSCPQGMCYIGIEYECSKDYQLQFYTKEYLASYPKSQSGSASFLLMRLKPDRKTGTHSLPLKGAVMQTAVFPDTVKIPAELFLYYEKKDEWMETV